eukprot:1159931-Pelagomonas_calceolata.AAC.6
MHGCEVEKDLGAALSCLLAYVCVCITFWLLLPADYGSQRMNGATSKGDIIPAGLPSSLAVSTKA